MTKKPSLANLPEHNAAFCDWPTWRTLCRQDGWVVLVLAGLTIGLAVLWFSLGRDGEIPWNIPLAGLTIWICLISPVAAATGTRWANGLFRGGVVADSSAIGLLVCWGWVSLSGEGELRITLLDWLCVYAVWASVVVLNVIWVRCWPTVRSRMAAAFIAAAVWAVALCSPVWISHWMGRGPAARQWVDWAVRINPFQAVCQATIERTEWTWFTWGRMYNWSRLGDTVTPGPVSWWETCLCYLGVGTIVLVGRVAVGRLWRSRRGAIGRKKALSFPEET